MSRKHEEGGNTMDLFFSFVLQAAGYFITSYFLYSIFGRRLKVGYIFLIIVFLSNLYPYLMGGSQLETRLLILGIVYDVGPAFFAFLIFSSVTGGIPVIKIKRQRKIKGISTRIQTKNFSLTNAVLALSLSVIAGSTSFVVFEGITRFVILLFSVIGLLFGLFLLMDVMKIKQERVIVFVGRAKEKFYVYDIPPKARYVEITDFFTNENYILDRIGEVTLNDETKKQDKDYLYWIATSDKVKMEPPLFEINHLLYQDDLDQFEKYHLKHVWYDVLKTGKLEKVKEKLIK